MVSGMFVLLRPGIPGTVTQGSLARKRHIVVTNGS
jgi:hypothetical protein